MNSLWSIKYFYTSSLVFIYLFVYFTLFPADSDSHKDGSHTAARLKAADTKWDTHPHMCMLYHHGNLVEMAQLWIFILHRTCRPFPRPTPSGEYHSPQIVQTFQLLITNDYSSVSCQVMTSVCSKTCSYLQFKMCFYCTWMNSNKNALSFPLMPRSWCVCLFLTCHC